MALGKNKVLGKGLANLISGSDSNPTENNPKKEVRISEIQPNPFQPRKIFSSDSLQELSTTIQQHGIIQPLIVRISQNGGYTLVSGERRLRAAKLAGFQKVPVVVRDYSDSEILELAMIENLQREDLNPMEEALGYQAMMDKLSIKVSDVASKVGKNRSTVANLLRLLSLPHPIQVYIRDGKLSEGQARPLIGIVESKKQLDLANKIITEQWNVRTVENYVSNLLHPEKKKQNATSKTKDPSILKIENKLRNKLSTKLEIQHSEKKGSGRISIVYNSLADLDRILENIGLKA